MIATVKVLSNVSATLKPNLLSNLEGLDEIHVHCAQLRTQFMSSVNLQPLSPSDVIAVIPVDTVFGTKQSYQPPVTLQSLLMNTNIVALEFQLTDSLGRLLDFNGVDWSMVLKCEEIDVSTPTQLSEQGTINTPFQDQLAALEGTAHAEIRSRRKRGNLDSGLQFYESNKLHNSQNKLY